VSKNTIGAPNVVACGSANNVGVFVDQGVTGTTIELNTIVCNTLHGVQVMSSTSVAVIGNDMGLCCDPVLPNGGNGVCAVGTTGLYFHGNVISGNGSAGILFENSTFASVFGNYIGTDPAVAASVPNGGDGVPFTAGSHHNAIGSGLVGDRNIISGNANSGVLLDGSGTHDNTVVGNYIGTDLRGTAAIANGLIGVQLQNSTHNNTIGGVIASDGNVISGNSQAGVLIEASNNNVVSSNLIGLDAAGTSALPNGQEGVCICNSSTGNTVGSSDINQAQYIGGNTGSGVLFINSDGNSVLASNRIGVGPSSNAFGNGDGGVFIIDSADNTVDPSLVANNKYAGVAAVGITSTGNFLRPLHVYGNSGLPVDLGNDGPTPNDGDDDTGTGANNLLEYPVITASAGSVITGTVCANCSVYVYQAIGNPAAAYGGGDFLQAVLADGSGRWSTTLTGGMTRSSVTLQAYDSASNTSEFSPRPILFLPVTRR
jgi:Periplasmic copper-binding protein (NosD)